jgi:hypothetical protein
MKPPDRVSEQSHSCPVYLVQELLFGVEVPVDRTFSYSGLGRQLRRCTSVITL